MFRPLNADEVECKVATVSEKGVQLLIYKTARTDMELLDETVGPNNWQDYYEEIKGNVYCTIEIWDEEKGDWVGKSDCGVESAFGDKEKGEASDAFKRAGFRWGIGRELYSSPFIWFDVRKDQVKLDFKKDKEGNPVKDKWGKVQFTTKDRFSVLDIQTEDGKIKAVVVRNLTQQKTLEFR